MNEKHNQVAAALTQALDGIQLDLEGDSASPRIDPRINAEIERLGLRGYVGWIVHAGQAADGTFPVQFNVTGNGWSSRWPKWAYEIAMHALLQKMQVWIAARGEPYGPNLIIVSILQ